MINGRPERDPDTSSAAKADQETMIAPAKSFSSRFLLGDSDTVLLRYARQDESYIVFAPGAERRLDQAVGCGVQVRRFHDNGSRQINGNLRG
jgi:hypothetical protein